MENERGVVASIVNLAELEFIHGNAETALDLIDRALVLAPDSPDASTHHNNRSAYCIALDRWDEAFGSATAGLTFARRNGVGIDVAFAVQRFAAIAALRDHDFVRSAILIGCADARIEAYHGDRQFTERVEYERVVRLAREALGTDNFAKYSARGSSVVDDDLMRYVFPEEASPLVG